MCFNIMEETDEEETYEIEIGLDPTEIIWGNVDEWEYISKQVERY